MPANDVLMQDGAIDWIVIDGKHPQPPQVAFLRTRTHSFRQRDGEPESAPFPQLAFDTNFTTHQANKPAANGEAQPCPAILPGSRYVGLFESFKQAVALFRRD